MASWYVHIVEGVIPGQDIPVNYNHINYINEALVFVVITYQICSSCTQLSIHGAYGPLTRYLKLLVAHAPGMPGTFSPPPGVKRSRHASRHVPWCIPGSLTSGFLLSRWRGKRSRHPRRMRNPQLYVSGKRPMKTENRHDGMHADGYLHKKKNSYSLANILKTLKPRQNGRRFAYDTFKRFSWMKILEFRLRFHWSLFLRVQLTIIQHWFR